MNPPPILIIDDDPVARLLVASVLVDAGHPVDTVSSVAAALATAEGDWGAVVLDPQVEDFLLDDTVERLRTACRAPIVVSTAPEIAADPDIGRGADAVLARVEDHERALLAQIRRLLAR